MVNLYIPVCGLFLSITVFIIFIFKNKANSIDTKLFFCMIMGNLLNAILTVVIIYFGYTKPDAIPLFIFLNKIDFISYLVWISSFFLYIFHVSFNGKKLYNKFNLITRISIVVDIFVYILTLIMPVNIVNDGYMYSYGSGITILYLTVALYVLAIILIALKNYKDLYNKKYIPLYALVFIVIVAMIVRRINPGLLIISTTIAYVNFIMYVTIENPDFKLLKELNYQKEQVLESKEATSKVIASISNNLNPHINTLVAFANKKFDYDDKKVVKEEINKIQDYAKEVVIDISNLLELAKIQNETFEVKETKYEPIELINNIINFIKVKDKTKTINYNKDYILPMVLYGDSEKTLQAVVYFYSGIIKISNKDEYDLKIDTIRSGSLFRLKFTITLEKDDILKEYLNDTDFTNILEFQIVKRLLTRLNGKLNIKNKNNTYIFELSIDEKLVNEYEDYQEKINNPKSNIKIFEIPDKRILLIDDNKARVKEVKLMLSPYKMEVDTASNFMELRNKFESNKTYDLVILDDIMPDIEEVKSYLLVNTSKKLFRIMNNDYYEVKKIMLVTPNKNNLEKRYLEEGFDEVITKPLNKNKIHNLLKRYFD